MFDFHNHAGKRVMAMLLVFAMMFAMLGEYAPSWFTAFALERSGNRGSSISEGVASGSRGSSRSSRSSSQRSGRSHARSSSSDSRTSKSGSDLPDSRGSQLFSSSSGRANRYDSDRSVRSYA